MRVSFFLTVVMLMMMMTVVTMHHRQTLLRAVKQQVSKAALPLYRTGSAAPQTGIAFLIGLGHLSSTESQAEIV